VEQNDWGLGHCLWRLLKAVVIMLTQPMRPILVRPLARSPQTTGCAPSAIGQVARRAKTTYSPEIPIKLG
jgi:hypothetical protein